MPPFKLIPPQQSAEDGESPKEADDQTDLSPHSQGRPARCLSPGRDRERRLVIGELQMRRLGRSKRIRGFNLIMVTVD